MRIVVSQFADNIAIFDLALALNNFRHGVRRSVSTVSRPSLRPVTVNIGIESSWLLAESVVFVVVAESCKAHFLVFNSFTRVELVHWVDSAVHSVPEEGVSVTEMGPTSTILLKSTNNFDRSIIDIRMGDCWERRISTIAFVEAYLWVVLNWLRSAPVSPFLAWVIEVALLLEVKVIRNLMRTPISVGNVFTVFFNTLVMSIFSNIDAWINKLQSSVWASAVLIIPMIHVSTHEVPTRTISGFASVCIWVCRR